MDSATIYIGLAAGLLALYYFLLSPFDFWKKRGVPYLERQFPVVGTLKNLYVPFDQFVLDWYKSFPGHKFFGTFTLWRPSIVITDPELIENILIKDFSYFYNRANVIRIDTNPLAKNLVNYHDEKWKALRNKLTPTFSSGKLKGMHPQLVQGAKTFSKYLSKFSKNDELNFKDLCGRYSMDMVASCAFGLDLDIMNNPESEFYEIGKKTFMPSYIVRGFFMLQSFLAPIYKFFGLGLISKSLTTFFINAVDTTLEYREKNNITRPDFLHLMNELKKKDDELVRNNQLDPNDPAIFDHNSLVSNAFVFLAAGYETTASTLSFFFYDIALNPEIQEKLHKEIVEVTAKHNGEMSFEAISEMTYLDMTISETLRLHPPAAMLERKTSKDYKIPGSDTVIPTSATVFVPIYALHLDPQYFPEPEKFKPERFDPEKNAITKGTYLPFGGGPRMCIAARFASLEMKVGAAMILKNYKILPCSKTSVPLKYDRRSIFLTSLNGLWLSVEKRAAPMA